MDLENQLKQKQYLLDQLKKQKIAKEAIKAIEPLIQQILEKIDNGADIRQSLKEISEAILKIDITFIENEKLTNFLNQIVDMKRGLPGADGEPGQDGYTPQKGVDYYTDIEQKELIRKIVENIELPKPPQKGVDYFTNKEINQIIDISKSETISIIEPMLSSKIDNTELKLYAKKSDTVDISEFSVVRNKLNKLKIEYNTPSDLVKALESLSGSSRLDKSAIKGFSEFENAIKSEIVGVINRSGTTINSLGDIADVDLTGLQDQDIIRWDSASGKWLSVPLNLDADYLRLDASNDPITNSLELKNSANSALSLTINSGLSSSQISQIDLSDRDASYWQIRKDNTNNLIIRDSLNLLSRLQFSSTLTQFNTGSADIDFSINTDGINDFFYIDGGTNVATFYNGGLTIGDTYNLVLPSTKLQVTNVFNETSGTTQMIRAISTVTPTGGAFTGTHYNLFIQTGTAAGNTGTLNRIYGAYFEPLLNGSAGSVITDATGFYAAMAHGSARTVTNSYGVRSKLDVTSALNTTTNFYNFYAEDGSKNASATVTNHFGLYIENIALGSTGNYAIFTNAGRHSYGGSHEYRSIATQTSASLTLDATHRLIRCDATSNNITINLPSAGSCTGREYIIKKIDSSVNTVTIDANASQLIDGALTQTLSSQWDYILVQSNGTSWDILA